MKRIGMYVTGVLLEFGLTFGAYAVNVHIPEVTVLEGQTVQLPISIDGVVGQGLRAAKLVLTYDATLLTATNASIVGAVTADWFAETNFTVSGEARISMASPTGLTQDGLFLTLTFSASSLAPDTTQGRSVIAFSTISLNEGQIPAVVTGGGITVQDTRPIATPPTAVSAIEGVAVTITLTGTDPLGAYTARPAPATGYHHTHRNRPAQ